MRIGLIDVDGHRYPNLALMKLSSWHKSKGDLVEWWWSDLVHYDIVYMSKVFGSEYSPDIPPPLNADKVIRGGTGYAITMEDGREVYYKELDGELPPEAEKAFPDYAIYPELTEGTAYGFLTRGCPRGCGFCHVGCKEGRVSRRVADLREFWSGQREIKLMDPNILACHDRWKLLEQLKASGARVDFNQGLDIRLTDRDVAKALGDMRIKSLHFAWDDPAVDLTEHFERFTDWYRRKDHRTKMVYVLTNFGSTHEEDLYRVYTIRRLGYDPYIMIYNKNGAPSITRQLQRWCNNKIIFGAEPDFKKYNSKVKKKGGSAGE